MVMLAMSKQKLLQTIIELLDRDQKLLLGAARKAHLAATDPENAPDNKYETLALESSYIAQGQANRAQEVKKAIDLYRNLTLRHFADDDPVYLTALVTIASASGGHRSLFIGPAAGGLKFRHQGSEVVVITPDSPLGRDLLGKEVGDVIEIEVQGVLIEYELIELS